MVHFNWIIMSDFMEIITVRDFFPSLWRSTSLVFLTLGTEASETDGESVARLFGPIGKVWKADEKLFDAITGLSGSGPAYIYLAIEALADGEVAAGIPRELALGLASQTKVGGITVSVPCAGCCSRMGSSASEDFSVLVLASDLGVDARPFLAQSDRENEEEPWHDCPSYLDEDFSDLEALQFFRLEPASDKSGNRIFRIVGKYFPAVVISGERLKKYVFHKISTEMPEGPYCIVYMHSTVQEDNSPGLTILRWIYEELPSDFKDRLQVVYFIHPGLRSRLVFATLGRFFLSGGLYWKIKYVSRLQYLWDDIKKGELEIPEFVREHDNVLEHRPLTDYGIEPDPYHLTEIPTMSYSLGRYEAGWAAREYTS